MNVTIDYTNYKGFRAFRLVRPIRLYWGSTKYYLEQQWLLEAMDILKQQTRTFAMKDIHNWGQVEVKL